MGHQLRKVDKVFVFERSGIPKLMLNFNDDTLVVDEMLLSGFLSAIDGFSINLFKDTSSHFIIDQGDRKISLFKGNKIVLAIISPENLLPLKSQFDQIMEFFTEKYPLGGGKVLNITEYEEFQIKITRILFYLPIAEDWIPVPITDSEIFNSLKKTYPILSEFDGKTEIGKINGFNQNERENIFEILNYAYFEKTIIFENFIEPKDFIIGTEKLQTLIEPNSEIYRKLRLNFPRIKTLTLIQDLESFTRVFDIEQKHGETALKAIEFLYKFECIEIVDENFRKILITLEILNDLLKTIQIINKNNKKIHQSLRAFFDKIDNPEILTKIDFNGKYIQIDISRFPYKSIFHKNMKRIYDLWHSLGSLLIKEYYKKNQKMLNSMFFSRMMDHYMEILHDSEMDVLDPFLEYIEAACSDL